MNCDSIEWLVDILGTVELLASVGDCKVYQVRRASVGNNGDGLYFSGAHWYSVKGGEKKDAYKEGYQSEGTAHFCQTFAVMIYLGEISELRKDAFKANISSAMDFWINILENDTGLANYIINEIKTSRYVEEKPFGGQYKLSNITRYELIQFLLRVKSNAGTFVGCRSGV